MPFKPGQSGNPKGRTGPNKVTADIRAAALEHGPAALERLAHLAQHAESEATQVAAAKEILDRAYGRSSLAIGQAPDLQPVTVVERHIVDDRERAKAVALLLARQRPQSEQQDVDGAHPVQKSLTR